MLTTKKHFEIFEKECNKWIKILNLDDWRIGILHEDLKDEDTFAQCRSRYRSRVAELILNSSTDINEKIVTEKYIKLSAKHECIHLMLAILTGLANERYLNYEELESCEEGLVRRLEKLL